MAVEGWWSGGGGGGRAGGGRRAVVVVTQPGAMVMVWGCVAVRLGSVASTTCTVKSNVPAAVGVPVITPVSAAIVRPGGRVPSVTDQVNGAVPPSTARTSPVYGSHSVPSGSSVQEICTAPLMF